jgi:hypothetical protein
MGTWGSGIFDDDLALDIKGRFESEVEAGGDPAEVASGLMQSDLAREILEEFDEAERDEAFWEESGALFFAVAHLQLEHGVLSPEVRRLTLQAIEAWKGIAAGDDERLESLDELQARLDEE